MANATADLLSALGITASEGEYLNALTSAEQAKLVATIERTQQKHHDEITQALENTLDNVPRVLRGTFRKLFS